MLGLQEVSTSQEETHPDRREFLHAFLGGFLPKFSYLLGGYIQIQGLRIDHWSLRFFTNAFLS